MQSSEEKLMRSPRIQLHLNVHEPIELVELTLAFQGIGYEYQSYIKKITAEKDKDGKNAANDVKLYITKIRSNCILADLAPALPMLGLLAPVFSEVKTISEFIGHVKDLINWLKSISKSEDLTLKDIPYNKRKINNVKDVVRLVANNKDSSLGLSALTYEESSGEDRVALKIEFSDLECKEAEQGAVRALRVLDDREKADKEKVLMYFYQLNIDDPKSGGRTGDKAFISSVIDKPLSVFIISEIDQQRIRYELDDKTHNPLYTGFIVDVNIEKDPRGRPKVYRVLRVHEVIYDDE